MSNEAKKVWTRGEIEDMLRTQNGAVERAMVAIWEKPQICSAAPSTSSINLSSGTTRLTRPARSASHSPAGRRCTLTLSVNSPALRTRTATRSPRSRASPLP